MQGTVRIKVHLLETLDDGSVDPNCYACKMGHVILTDDGRISSDSPAVKAKQLLIKKNGKVDNRSAICKKTVDQDRLLQSPQIASLPAAQQNAMVLTHDSMDASTPNIQQSTNGSVVLGSKQSINKSIPPTPPLIPPTPWSALDTTAQACVPPQSGILANLTSSIPQQHSMPSISTENKQSSQLQSQLQAAEAITTTQLPQSTNPQEKLPTPKGSESWARQANSNKTMFIVDPIFSRAYIPRSHEFTWEIYSPDPGRKYFTYNFICFLQRLFHRPVDTEEESTLGLQPFYNSLSHESKDILSRNLPGCEKELAQRLLGQNLQFLGQSSLSVVDIIANKITEDKPFTNACQTLYQLSVCVKNALTIMPK